MEQHELRCALWFDARRLTWPGGEPRGALLLDADLLHGVDGKVQSSEPLARAAVAWEDPGNEDAAWAAIVSGAEGWEQAPARLPDHDARRFWGVQVAHILENAIGPDALDELLIDRARTAPVRLVFRAVDEVAANVPFEALAWRTKRGESHPTQTSLVNGRGEERQAISILRVADRVELGSPPRLGAVEPGRHETALLFPRGRGREFAVTVQAATRTLSVGDPKPFTDSASLSARATGADLLIVAGHGGGPSGLEMTAGTMDGRQISHSVRAAGTVVLAMCGSAQPAELACDPTREVARAGVALAIGFQGSRASVEQVRDFLSALTSVLSSPLAGEDADHRLSLSVWESAIDAGRQRIGDGAVVPVVYVHPGLLLGTTSQGRPVARRQSEQRRASTPARRILSSVRFEATAWCVPGQLVLANTASSGPVRVPLPVDVGVKVSCQEISASEPSALEGTPVMTPEDLSALLVKWGEPDLRVRVTVTESALASAVAERVRGWARRSAEAVALVRVLSQITRQPVSAAVSRHLDGLIRSDSGAHGPQLSFVSATDGRMIRSSNLMLPWIMAPAGEASPAGLNPESLLLACQAREIEELAALSDDLMNPDWLIRRLDDQCERLLRDARCSWTLSHALRSRGTMVVFPDVATLAASPASPASPAGPGPARLLGRDPST